MSEPSAAEIAAMRAEAERDRVPPEPKKKKKKRKLRDRVSLEMLPDGGLLEIATPFTWGHLALVLLVGVFVLPVTISQGVAVGMIGIGSLGALVLLILFLMPTWHVRWTNGGDVIVYKRNPRRPTWVGRCANLLIETSMTTSKKKFIGWLKFLPTNAAKHFYPITKADTDAMHEAARAANFEKKRADWGI